MNIKKSLLLFLMVVLVFSCKQDEILDKNTGTADLTTDLSQYDNSNLGLYKGTFTTLDATERGIVEVKILLNVPSKATLSLTSGATIALESTSIVTQEEVTNLSFVSIADTEETLSFDLSVNADGTSIEITNTNLGNRASHIIAAKETSRAPVVPITGSFYCTSCGTTNWTSGQTFNLLFIGDPSGAGEGTLDTVFTVNEVVFSSVGTMDNNQVDCAPNGIYTDCTISGFTNINGPGNDITWSGIHKYITDPGTCSQANGIWDYVSPTFGTLSGIFTSDLQCVAPVNDLCSDAIIVTPGATLTLDATASTGTGNPTTPCGPAPQITPGTASGLWYVLTDPGGPPPFDNIFIDTEGSNYDTKIIVYTGGCGTLTCLTANDNIEPGNPRSRVIFPSAGDGSTQYWILVSEGDGAAAGTESVLNVKMVNTVTAIIETDQLLLDLELTCDTNLPCNATAYVSYVGQGTEDNKDFLTVVNLNDIMFWNGTTSNPEHQIRIEFIEPIPPNTGIDFFSGSEALGGPVGELGLEVTSGVPGETMPYLIYFQIIDDGVLLEQVYFTDPKIRIN